MKYFKVKRSEVILFAVPALIMMLFIVMYPLINVILMSFHDWYALSSVEGHPFVGFRNYRRIFQTSQTWVSLKITIWFVLGSLALEFSLGLMLALLFNQKFKGRKIARTLMIVPWVIPLVPWSLTIMLIFDTNAGIVNQLLMNVGLAKIPVDWLGTPSLALLVVIVARVWKNAPFAMVMLLAGMQGISQDLYEVAKVDGASPMQRFFFITFPLLKPVIIVITILLVIWHLRDFALIYVITRGGPYDSTAILAITIWKRAFQYFRFGESAALAIILLVFALTFSYFYLHAQRVEE